MSVIKILLEISAIINTFIWKLKTHLNLKLTKIIVNRNCRKHNFY